MDSGHCAYLPEFQTVIAVAWLDHLWEPSCVLAPVELAGVDYHASNRGAVAAYPLCSGMNHDVCAVCDGASIETAGAECVVDLAYLSQLSCG